MTEIFLVTVATIIPAIALIVSVSTWRKYKQIKGQWVFSRNVDLAITLVASALMWGVVFGWEAMLVWVVVPWLRWLQVQP